MTAPTPFTYSQQGLCDALNEARVRGSHAWRVTGAAVARLADSGGMDTDELLALTADQGLQLGIEGDPAEWQVTRKREDWAPPRPDVIRFPVYLHDGSYLYEQQDLIEKKSGVRMTAQEIERAGRPFYEVVLDVELRLSTGEVKLIEARL